MSSNSPSPSQTGSNDNVAVRVGIGVGVGIGGPLILIAGILMGVKVVKERQPSPCGNNSHNAPPSGQFDMWNLHQGRVGGAPPSQMAATSYEAHENGRCEIPHEAASRPIRPAELGE